MKIIALTLRFARFNMLAGCALLAIGLFAGCGSKSNPPAEPTRRVEAGTSNEYFISISDREIRLAEGAKFETVLGGDGKASGVKIMARDNNNIRYMTCVCAASGCAPRANSPCNMESDHSDTGSSRFWCVGGCYTSEETSCGCAFGYPPEDDSGSSDAVRPTGTRPILSRSP